MAEYFMPISNNADIVKIEDIDAALTVGAIFSNKKWTICLKFILILTLIVLFCSLLLCIIDIADKDWLWTMIVGICFLFFWWLLYLIINSGKKKVRVWLQDAVILRARTKKIDDTIEVRYPGIFFKATAIQIRFSYMKKHYVRSSDQPGKISRLLVYNKYADKDILIAYSPKYDQVMLIRPKSEERIRASMDI